MKGLAELNAEQKCSYHYSSPLMIPIPPVHNVCECTRVCIRVCVSHPIYSIMTLLSQGLNGMRQAGSRHAAGSEQHYQHTHTHSQLH